MLYRKKVVLVTCLFFIILIIIVLSYNRSNNNNTDSINTPIEDLVNNSLSIQYGKSFIDLNSVFTTEFIDRIDSNKYFYKKNLKPYKIVYKNYKLHKVGENEFVIRVHIEDMNGRYIQVIHLIKIDDIYLISNIEYDI